MTYRPPLVFAPLLALLLTSPAFPSAKAVDGSSWLTLVSSTCSFLPASPAPTWTNKRPEIPDVYVGVGQAARQGSPEEQIRAAEEAARHSLASEIEVQIKGEITIVETQSGRQANTEVRSLTEARVKELLRDARIQERWLDRSNCILWALATVSRSSVETVRQEIQVAIQRKFTSKKVMLFDLSGGEADMASAFQGRIEQLFRELGVTLSQPDIKLAACALENWQPPCQELPNTMYAGFTVALEREKLSDDGQSKGRYFRVKGGLRYRDRLVSSFDVTCRGIGKVGQDTQSTDRWAAEECVKKAGKIIREDVQKSE